MTALIVSAVVVERAGAPDVAVTSPGYSELRRTAAQRWGLGTELQLRLEPLADAIAKGERAHYFAHVVRPYADALGLSLPEAHLALKAACLPDGTVSITELDADAFRDYVLRAAAQARAWAPDAFVLEEDGR